MSTSPSEVRRQRSRGLIGALAFCLVALGLMGGKAYAVDQLTLVSSSPAHSAVNVSLTAPIVLTFNGPVKTGTDDPNILTSSGTIDAKITIAPSNPSLGLSYSVSSDNKTITINHSVAFTEQTQYIVTIRALKTKDAAVATDDNDGQLTPVSGSAVNPFIFSTIDHQSPYIVNHTPTNNDGVTQALGALQSGGTIQVTFDEPMDPNSVINNTTVTATSSGGGTTNLVTSVPLSLSMTSNNSVLLITLNTSANSTAAWPGSASSDQWTKVTVTVNGTDLSGNLLIANPNGVADANVNPFTFRDQDTAAPTLASSSPSAGQTNVDNGQAVILNFNEPINTVNFKTQSDLSTGKRGASVQIYQGDWTDADLLPGTVTASFSNSNKTVTLNHSFTFSSGVTYNVRILGKNDAQGNAYVIQDTTDSAHINAIGDAITFSFTVLGGVAPIVISVSPSNNFGVSSYSARSAVPSNDNRFDPSGSISITFSAPMNTSSSSFVTTLQDVTNTDSTQWTTLATTAAWSNSNQTVTITPVSKLGAGDNEFFQLKIVTAQSAVGRAFVAGDSSLMPNGYLLFATKDQTPTLINSLSPANGANIDPAGQVITINLDELLKQTDETQSGTNIPVWSNVIINIQSLSSGNPKYLPQLLGNNNSVVPALALVTPFASTSNTIQYKVPQSAFLKDTKQINLNFNKFMNLSSGDVTTVPAGQINTGQYAFYPGDSLVFSVSLAYDLNGNAMQNSTTPAPNPWIYNITDLRPPQVTRVRVGTLEINANDQTGNTTFPLSSLTAPIEVTFSKPLSTADLSRMTFTFTSTDTTVTPSFFTNATSTGANTWKADASAYSSDLRVVTLTHKAFAEKTPSDTANDVTVRLFDTQNPPQPKNFNTHTFTITGASDSVGNSVMNGNVARTISTNTALAGAMSFITTSKPRIIDVQYEDPNSGFADNNGLITTDTTLKHWVSIVPDSLVANIPLNSRILFKFDATMDQSTVPSPQFTTSAKLVSGWTPTWATNSQSVTWDHSDLFTGANQTYARGNTSVAPSAAVYKGLTLGGGTDIKGDTIATDTPASSVNLNPIDVTVPTSLTVEYLRNINDLGDNNKLLHTSSGEVGWGDGTKADWEPLNGATNVPTNTLFRVRMNETFGPGGTYNDDETNAGVTTHPISLLIQEPSDHAAVSGLTTNLRPTAFISPNDGTSTYPSRQNIFNSDGSVKIAGGQTIFRLGLIGGNVGNPDTDESRGSYAITFVAGDTRLDNNGNPANDSKLDNLGNLVNFWEFGSLPNAAFSSAYTALVPGNQIKLTASFTTEDRVAPVVRSITGTPSITQMNPDSPIVVKFDEPVDINTVNLTTLDKPDAAAVPTFTKAYGTNGTDKTTVVFTATTLLLKPSSGSPNVYYFAVNTGVNDIKTSTNTGNAVNTQNTVSSLNLGSDHFQVNVPADTTPPTIRSIVSTREEITLQYSKPVVSVGSSDGNYSHSAINPVNYVAGLKPEINDSPYPGDFNTTPKKTVMTTGANYVNYTYYNPNRTAVVNGTTVLSPGYVTVNKAIKNIYYNSASNAVVIQVDPLTEGQGTGQSEYVGLYVMNTIQDLNTNPFATTSYQARVQEGRADWRIQMTATSNVSGASPDSNNYFGVFGIPGADGSSSDGYDTPGTNGDIPKPIVPGANHVIIFSARGNAETGFVGNGGNYAQDIQSRPLIGQARTWPDLGVQTDLGATGAPATITLTWNLALSGQEVPLTHSIELINLNPQAGEPTSIDLRAQSSFTYQVANNGLDQTRFFRLVVTAPGVQSAPSQLNSGFNMVSVPVQAQNPAVTNVFYNLSPQVVYRYDPTTGYEIFPSLSSFTTITSGRGYFVRPNTAGYQMSILGVPAVGAQTLTIKKGWNLIADPFSVAISGSNISVTSGGSTMTVANAVKAGIFQDAFFTFDSTLKGYTASQALSTGTLQPWKAYWLLAFKDATLTVGKPTAQ